MKQNIIAFATVTYANKAKALFSKAGISAEIIRTPRTVAGGCGYSITASAPVDRMVRILEDNGIPYKSVSENWRKE
ncbi:MAG: DUF3343 domain-containing protein [Huintestinicola sp.]